MNRGPKGIAELRIRSWECSCGASHDRDVNAVINILRFGLERQAPVVEIPALKSGEDVNTHPHLSYLFRPGCRRGQDFHCLHLSWR